MFPARTVWLQLQRRQRLILQTRAFQFHLHTIGQLQISHRNRRVGMAMHDGIADVPNGMRIAWFKDPEGNTLSISTLPELPGS